MRLVAFMPQASVIDQLLAHLRTRARPPRPRPPHAYRPRRPAPQRGRVACAAVPPRRHRGRRRPQPPPLTAAGAARTAPGREAGHAATSHAVLARSAIAPDVRRMVDRPRLKFLSRRRKIYEAPASRCVLWPRGPSHVTNRNPLADAYIKVHCSGICWEHRDGYGGLGVLSRLRSSIFDRRARGSGNVRHP